MWVWPGPAKGRTEADVPAGSLTVREEAQTQPERGDSSVLREPQTEWEARVLPSGSLQFNWGLGLGLASGGVSQASSLREQV